MAGIASSLVSGGIEGAGKGIASVIDAIRGRNPEDAAKLQEIIGRHADLVTQTDADVTKAELQSNVDLNQIAGQNIRAEQSNKFTAWARPGVIWGGLLILIWNYCVLQTLPPRWGYKPFDFPSMFWEIWCICVTGYVFARSLDKVTGGSGGSVQLPGIKIDSKGD